jgi:hypothetical protein
VKRGPKQILTALSELFNAAAWGDAHQSFSARAWYAKTRGKHWGRVAVVIVDAIFGKGHCQKAWEAEQCAKT